jgi:hypothetical protein
LLRHQKKRSKTLEKESKKRFKMPEKLSENIFKNREKPISTGVLRFLVYGIIAESAKPVTIAQILQQIQDSGNFVGLSTVQRSVTDMIRANAFSPVKIQSITVHAGRSRSRAFYFSKKKT